MSIWFFGQALGNLLVAGVSQISFGEHGKPYEYLSYAVLMLGFATFFLIYTRNYRYGSLREKYEEGGMTSALLDNEEAAVQSKDFNIQGELKQ